MSVESVEHIDDRSNLYSERLQVEGVFRLLFVAASVGILAGGIAIYVVFLDASSLRSPIVWVWLLGSIYTTFMALTYRQLEIRLDGDTLKLKLCPFHSSLPVSEITGTHIARCRSEPAFRQWIHPGFQIGLGFRSWTVPFRGGVSVHLQVEGKKKLVYVSSKAPDKFKAALDHFSETDYKAQTQ